MSALVGRERELVDLHRALSEVGTVAVVAAAGVGKTALLRAALEGRPTCWGAGMSMLLPRPYSALERATRCHLTGGPDEVADQVLHRCDGDLLVIDDLHWVHDATVDVLQLLIGRAPLVVATRPEVGAGVEALLGRPDVHALSIGPLPARDAERMARRCHPQLDGTARDALLQAAGGSPLLIEQLVMAGTTSPTLHAAVAARLGTLDQRRREVLGRLALLGRPATASELGGTPGTDLVAAAPDGRHEFRHDALAQGVDAQLDEAERVRLHRELAAAGLPDGEAAAHHLAGGDPSACTAAAERALDRTDNVAERADLRRLVARATEALAGPDVGPRWVDALAAMVGAGRWRDVIADAERVEDEDPLVCSDVRFHRGRARWFLGDVDGARADLDGAAALVGDRDPVRGSIIATERANLEVRDRQPGSLALAEAAVDRACELGVDVAQARSTLGAALLYEGRPEWEPVLRQAIEEAVEAGNAYEEARATYQLASGLGFHARLLEAVDIGSAQTARTRAAGLGTWTAHFEQAALIQRTALGTDPSGVLADAERHLVEHRTFRNRFQVHLAKVVALLDLGRFDEARAAAEAFEHEVDLEQDEQVSGLAAALAELAWHVDDAATARRALELGRPVADAYFGIHLLTERTAAYVVDHDDAGEPTLPALAMPTWWPALHELEGLRLVRSGEHRAGAAELRRAAEQLEALAMPRWAVRAGVAAIEADPTDRGAPARRRHLVDLARRAGLVGTLRRLGVPVHAELTAAEEAVLRRVADGATTRDVAAALGVSAATVDQHIESARRKLGAATRLEAALRVRG